MDKDEMRKEVRQMIREELPKLIPELFGRTMLQIKEFFIKNIK